MRSITIEIMQCLPLECEGQPPPQDGWNDVLATWPSSSWQIAQLSLTAGSHNMNMQTAAKNAASTTLSGRLPNRSTSTVLAVMQPLERNKGICLDNLREIFNTMVNRNVVTTLATRDILPRYGR